MTPVASTAASPSASSTRKALESGSHRTLPPAGTLALIMPHLRELGITRVANVTGLDHVGIPTVMVTRPNARTLSVSQGKGPTLSAAQASGIMEATELEHAENTALPLQLASHNELQQHQRIVDYRQLPRFVHAYHPDTRVLWTPAVDERRQHQILVPFEMVQLDLVLPLHASQGYFPIGSNGLASGVTRLEALLHGAWELVERDALALFAQRGPAERQSRRLRLESIDDPIARDLLERFARADLGVVVWDATSDIPLPVFTCSVLERQPHGFRPIGIARGSGCHADRGVALTRALCEAAQSRLTRIAGARDDISPHAFAALREERSLEQQRRQLFDGPEASRLFSITPSRTHATLEEDLDWTLAGLDRVGLDQLLSVDLSRPGLPIAVVRVLVPGLEGAAEVPNYQPGRRALAARSLQP